MKTGPKPKYLIEVGQRYASLVVEREAETHERKSASRRWICRCDCGNVYFAAGNMLGKGALKSCGCEQGKRIAVARTKHGHAGTSEYASWKMMIRRCYDNKYDSYHNYGGRGITVCDEWRNSFEKFLEDMGPKPEDKRTLDRIDNNGNYSPSNCQWADWEMQASNKRPRKDRVHLQVERVEV